MTAAAADAQELDLARGEPDGWARARWRLRDLRGRDRLFALAMFTLVLVPFAVALARALHDGWVPSGDEANIATRSFDVFSRHPPLTGLSSTSGLYGDNISANHPGPIEFYLLAVPLRVLGMTVGPLLTAAAINAVFALIALWSFFRRLGLTAMLWAGVVLMAVIWSAGTSLLTDTLSSNMTTYSLLCTAVLAWALIDGDLRLLPLTALVASYAAQQHLAAGLIVLLLMVVATIALTAQIVKRVRRGDLTIKKATRQWSLAAVAVAAACWAPVAYDEVSSHPGNLTQIVRFARDNTRPTVGMKKGVYQALWAVTPPTILARTDTYGLFFLHKLTPYRYALGLVTVGALVALAWGARARSRSRARLALVALVVLVAGIVDGSNVPQSVESWRVNLYRWTWTAAFVTWTALGMGAVLLVGRLVGHRATARRAERLAPVVLIVVAALIATSIAFVSGHDDHNREKAAFALEKRVGAAVLARVDRHHPVVVVSVGFASNYSIGPYVIWRLVQAGVPVEVSPALVSSYGLRRRYDPASGPSAIIVVSGTAKLPSAPGKQITIESFSPERTALLEQLSAAVHGDRVELAPGAREIIAREYQGLRAFALSALFSKLPTDPHAVLEQPDFLKLVVRGLIRSPAFDKTKVRRLLELPADGYTIGRDEQVEVRLLSPDQLRHTRLPGL